MTGSDQEEVTLDNHRTFYSIACLHYRQVEQLVAERDRRAVRSDEDIDFACEKNAAIQRSAMVSVIFSALTLEAFINRCGKTHIQKYYVNLWYPCPVLSRTI